MPLPQPDASLPLISSGRSRTPIDPALHNAVLRNDLDVLRRETRVVPGNPAQAIGRYAAMAGRDPQGHTPWLLAARAGHGDAMWLLEPWSDRHARDDLGMDAFMIACAKGRLNVVHALLERNWANPTAVDLTQRTPLMWATYRGHVDVVQCLLPLSNATALDQNGLTAFELAYDSQSWACADLLAFHTPLHVLDHRPFSESLPAWNAHRESQVLRATIEQGPNDIGLVRARSRL